MDFFPRDWRFQQLHVLGDAAQPLAAWPAMAWGEFNASLAHGANGNFVAFRVEADGRP